MPRTRRQPDRDLPHPGTVQEGSRPTAPQVDTDDLPEILDRICKQHSVSFNQEDTLRQKQAFPFMSPGVGRVPHTRTPIHRIHAPGIQG